MTEPTNNPATETARPDGAAFCSSDVVADAGQEPCAERTSDAARSGVGGRRVSALIWENRVSKRRRAEVVKAIQRRFPATKDVGDALEITIEDGGFRDVWLFLTVKEFSGIRRGGAEPEANEIERESKSGARSATDPKLSEGGGWRGPCTAGGKAAAEARAVTHGAVRCSAWLGASRASAEDVMLEDFVCSVAGEEPSDARGTAAIANTHIDDDCVAIRVNDEE